MGLYMCAFNQNVGLCLCLFIYKQALSSTGPLSNFITKVCDYLGICSTAAALNRHQSDNK